MGYITGLASAKTNLQKQSSRGVSGKLPPRKIAFRSGSGFGLGLALELGLGGTIFLGGKSIILIMVDNILCKMFS